MKKRLLLYIVHFSDTHLWFNDLDILNTIIQSQTDACDTFSQDVKQIQTITNTNYLCNNSNQKSHKMTDICL